MDIELFWSDKNLQLCKDVNINAGNGELALSGLVPRLNSKDEAVATDQMEIPAMD